MTDGRVETSRLHRHAAEILGLAFVTLILAFMGVFPGTVHRLVPVAAVLIGSVGVVGVYSWWAPGTRRDRMRPRVVAHTFILAAVTYATGWGFALPLVHLFAVADSVRHGSSDDVPTVVNAAAFWTLIGQILLTIGVLPSVHASSNTDTWGVAAFMVAAVTAVAARIQTLTKHLEEAREGVASSEQRFRSLVEDGSDVMLLVEAGVVEYASPSTLRVFGRHDEDMMGRDLLDVIHPDDRDDVSRHVASAQADRIGSTTLRCRIRHGDGRFIDGEVTVRRLQDDAATGGIVLNVRDVTERRALEAQLHHRAFHDDLTDLANRALFTDRVGHRVARARRGSSTCAVVFIDLHGFKQINDTWGHEAGDEVLRVVGHRLMAEIRDGDTASRLGGDEFAVLLDELRDTVEATAVADRLLQQLQAPMNVKGIDIDLRLSIGVAVHEADWSAQDLLRNADVAMYQSRVGGRRQAELFQPSMHEALLQRLDVHRSLDLAITAGDIEVHYQPIVSLDDRRVVGFEALARWRHPERGWISPAEFIPIAEDTGQIVQLGRHVLDVAVQQLAEWQRSFRDTPPLTMSVNVSMRQLQLGDVMSDVRAALTRNRVAPGTLTLELTESAFMAHDDEAVSHLHRLAAHGVKLAIDDFGTGYSSLSYLQRFPLDVLKIDRSFVMGLGDSQESPALVRAIVDMSHGLHLRSVAEGVETEEEFDNVRALGCELGQGWLFAAAAAAEEMTLMLARRMQPEGGPVLMLAG